jgi:hypothetical protein
MERRIHLPGKGSKRLEINNNELPKREAVLNPSFTEPKMGLCQQRRSELLKRITLI